MRVSVSQRGGLLGADQVTELVDGTARVVDAGQVTAERELDQPVRDLLAALAERCSAADAADAAHGEAGADAVTADPMATTVEIEVDGRLREITFSSGEDVPAEVTELVNAVLESPYRDPGTRWRSRG